MTAIELVEQEKRRIAVVEELREWLVREAVAHLAAGNTMLSPTFHVYWTVLIKLNELCPRCDNPPEEEWE